MDEIGNETLTPDEGADIDETTPPAAAAPGIESDEDRDKRHAALLELAEERFKQAYEAHKDDFEACEEVQDFIAGDQWPANIKSEREAQDRPCLTLDHLNQYVRHVVNSGLMRTRDVRVLAMSGEADDRVGDVLAGLIRQITQTSTSKVAYETGLRHSCQVGFGYWRCKVQKIPGTDLLEITIRKIKDPRMVLMDPFCEYPDGRDAHYVFVLSKLTKTEFKNQYPEAYKEGCKSWHTLDTSSTLPWINTESMVVAEYYYVEESGTVRWAVLCPDKVLSEGLHHGNVMPIIRVVGEEYEYKGKERKRGMINNSSMDAQRAYNYSSSAFIEAVALAPLAPFIAAAGQVEQFTAEWADAHRVPRAVLRYTPDAIGGQLLPPPQRAEPAGIPAGWQGMMTNLIGDTQMIMGLAQPSVLGTGGSPVQSGAGIAEQKEPGEVNTFHYTEHWYMAIEQTGRVLLAMIPYVYTEPQAVKITGDDGILTTAMLNPQQEKTVVEMKDAYDKVLSTSYNPQIGRYDVVITTGPSSASKKSETNKMLMTMVNADPTIMKVAGDLVVGSMDMAGADVLAKRMKAMLPPGVGDDEAGKLQLLQQAMTENQELKQSVADMEKIIMADREKSQAALAKAQLDASTKLHMSQLEGQADLFKQKLDDSNAIQLATMKAQVELETNTQNNLVKVMIAKIAAKSKIDVESIKAMSAATQEPTHEGRMSGYAGVMESLTGGGVEPVEAMPPPPPPPPAPEPMHLHVNVVTPPGGGNRSFEIMRPDGSRSTIRQMPPDDGMGG